MENNSRKTVVRLADVKINIYRIHKKKKQSQRKYMFKCNVKIRRLLVKIKMTKT